MAVEGMVKPQEPHCLVAAAAGSPAGGWGWALGAAWAGGS
jgi:hypothetical protein